MAMRWLTRDWQAGALPAGERETRWQSYLDHRDTTAIHLPPALHRLAARAVDGALTLHQAIPEWWTVEPDKALTLSVVTGDPGVEPQRIVVQYLGHLEVTGAGPAELDEWLTRPDARLLYDEIEVLPGRRFEQRFLLAPDGEFSVRFDQVLLLSAPATAEERDTVIARKAGTTVSAPEPASTAPAPTEPVSAAGEVPTTAEAVPEDLPEGSPSPAPLPAERPAPRKRSLRDALLSWLPGVRGPHA